MKRRKWILILCTMVSLMFVSGCWDKRELTDLAVISAIGIDRPKRENTSFTCKLSIRETWPAVCRAAERETGLRFPSIRCPETI